MRGFCDYFNTSQYASKAVWHGYPSSPLKLLEVKEDGGLLVEFEFDIIDHCNKEIVESSNNG